MTFGYTAGKKLKFVANVMVVCGGFASIAEVLPVHAFDLWWRHVELPHTTRSSAQLHNIVRSEQDVFCSASLLPSRHRSQIRWPDLLASSSSRLQLTGYLITETMNKCFGSGGGDLLLEATSCARLSLWRPLARWHPPRPADPITQVSLFPFRQA